MAAGRETVQPYQRALVVVAHPDDAESLAAGTVAKLVRAGTRVAYCIATNGEKGSGDRTMTPERLAAIRQEEQRQAAQVLGVYSVEFLGFPDCEVENTRQTRLAITAAIRRHRPNLLLVQNPDRTRRLGAAHRDHRIVAETALDCVTALIGSRLAFPELLAQELEPHVVDEVRLMVWEDPDMVVDISETIEVKVAALACHASQMPNRIALDRNVRERAAQLGKACGYPYAEAFVRLTNARGADLVPVLGEAT
jgi:LmbE family N-acetylglucosaminyl deacetylase